MQTNCLLNSIGTDVTTLNEPAGDVLEICRQLLLSEAYSGKARKPSTKDSLKKILSALIAAHAAGVSFETMAGLLTHAGLKVTPETVRSYYFVLRRELELSVNAKKHASALASFDNKLHKKLAAEGLKQAHPKFADQRTAGKPKESVGIKEATTITSQGEAVKTPRELVQPVGSLSKSTQSETSKTVVEPTTPLIESGQPVAISIDSVDTAKTLEEIEAISLEKEKDDSYTHPDLVEDLVLKSGQVYFSSGKPYLGTLKKKEIFLLRKGGNLIAPTPSRTGKDFVTMPRVL